MIRRTRDRSPRSGQTLRFAGAAVSGVAISDFSADDSLGGSCGATLTSSFKRAPGILLGGSYMTTPFTVFWFFSCVFFACILWRLGESLRIPWWAMGIVALSLTLVGPQLARLPGR
jgi:hypothetical protein